MLRELFHVIYVNAARVYFFDFRFFAAAFAALLAAGFPDVLAAFFLAAVFLAGFSSI